MLARSLAVTLALSAAVVSAAAPFLTITSAENAGATVVVTGVQNLLDPGSPITLVAGSVSTEVNLQGSSPPSIPRAIGTFTNGRVAAGTLLQSNQSAGGGAVYAGGIGVESGLLLSTGACTDNDPLAVPGTPLGAEGPNNGGPQQGDSGDNPGEVVALLQNLAGGATIFDVDFRDAVYPTTGVAIPGKSSDPTAVHFRVSLGSPGYLRLRWVFASDEYPAYIRAQWNDSFAILLSKYVEGESPHYTNLSVFRETTSVAGGSPPTTSTNPFRLQSLYGCGPKFFLLNQLAPSFGVNETSPQYFIFGSTDGTHHVQQATQADFGAPALRYDHEYGGFTIPLTSESALLQAGDYELKVVVQDIADDRVDSSLFLEAGSLKLFVVQPADFNNDGVVDLLDLDILGANFGQSGKTRSQGDANGDGMVDLLDLDILGGSWGQTGNRDLPADFNRDGVVDMADHTIWSAFNGTMSCANRFQGDADNDGDVDGDDLPVWQSSSGSGGGGSLMMLAGGGGMSLAQSLDSATRMVGDSVNSLAASAVLPPGPLFPTDRDMNGDGVVDAADISLIRAYLEGGASDEQ